MSAFVWEFLCSWSCFIDCRSFVTSTTSLQLKVTEIYELILIVQLFIIIPTHTTSFIAFISAQVWTLSISSSTMYYPTLSDRHIKKEITFSLRQLSGKTDLQIQWLKLMFKTWWRKQKVFKNESCRPWIVSSIKISLLYTNYTDCEK